MSDTTPRGDDDVLAGEFDQTNQQVSGLEGESGGTAQGENRSDAEQEDGTIAGGGVLDDFRDGRLDPDVGDAAHIGSTAAGDAQETGDRRTGD
jgi:hypothetical protein